ncbi:ABC transporter permease [Larkinella knui]|uniref:FtsX-like permease family protein n=1 Tax=Larkinella knui TaxID=2025310 RepID=A0A3P1CLQ4_9BACT|nr:ABC transporter permease [Larkinella knui]RRB14110.1 FtsX-like permease family protein [Larkinella knui]
MKKPLNSAPQPPRWATRLLHGFCPSYLVEEMEGDLDELFRQRIELIGVRKARIRYIRDVLSLVRPSLMKQKPAEFDASPPFFLGTTMIRNYFKIAFRNLLKNKVYSFINIAGLATGMAVAMLIGLWIWDELSFDSYHKNHDRLAYVMGTQTYNGETGTYHSIVVPLENELRTNYPSDFKRLSLLWMSTNILAVGDKKLAQSGTWAQPDFPEMLSLTMLKGSREAFRDPSSVLLSESVATSLFGNEDPINKVIRVDNKTNMKIVGVYEDLPHNTTFHDVRFLLPWHNTANWWNTQTSAWRNHGCSLVVQVSDQSDFDQLSAKIKDIVLPHIKEIEYISLHPMEQWHLYSEFKNGKVAGGRIQFVWLFGIIGAFVLLLACINFMNLSTARSEKRAKEVGIRKAIGSLYGQLIGQFLSESVLVAFIALVFSIALVWGSLSFFNHLADKAITIPWTTPSFWFLTIGFTLFTGFVSGSYPAFYLSSFKPVKVLKGTMRAGRFASLPRKVLVVIQFTVSISLIIGTIIVFRQIQHAKNRPVGYSRDGLITVAMNTPELNAHYNELRNELIESGGAVEMTESNSPPTQIWSNNSGFQWKGKDPTTDPLFGTIAVTHDFGKTVGWKIVAGRDFSRDFPSDSGSFILNESAVKLAGITNPVGKIMRWNGRDHVVTGVVKDMVMDSPFKPTVPTIFLMDYGWLNMIIVRTNPALSTRDALAKIEPVFKKFNPGSPFEYKFSDDEYARKFSDEERVGNLATLFAILAIFISCLGLFGLASFVAEQRTKEIGVRKVLGATVFNVWGLLSRDFVMLVIISCLIAGPLAWYFMNGWLQQYEYRSKISWWIFAVSGAGALLITLLTVSYQAIRAALTNPVKSLRSE